MTVPTPISFGLPCSTGLPSENGWLAVSMMGGLATGDVMEGPAGVIWIVPPLAPAVAVMSVTYAPTGTVTVPFVPVVRKSVPLPATNPPS